MNEPLQVILNKVIPAQKYMESSDTSEAKSPRKVYEDSYSQDSQKVPDFERSVERKYESGTATPMG